MYSFLETNRAMSSVPTALSRYRSYKAICKSRSHILCRVVLPEGQWYKKPLQRRILPIYCVDLQKQENDRNEHVLRLTLFITILPLHAPTSEEQIISSYSTYMFHSKINAANCGLWYVWLKIIPSLEVLYCNSIWWEGEDTNTLTVGQWVYANLEKLWETFFIILLCKIIPQTDTHTQLL